ncbi:MAG: class I SAM-dependent methyltransferase [Phycisphaerales bacterium]|nr:class I SAM-dependent methyltransferase [Phycisphaerales bacterium]
MSIYSPNDSDITAAALDFLHSNDGASLLARLADNPSPTIAQIEKLRNFFPQAAVHAALTLTQLQPKARQKFPALADRFIYAIPEALEQATDSAVASHKAGRFAQVLPSGGQILDLCAGIGGDSLALANVAPTTAVDLSAARLACLRYNAQTAPPQFPIQTQQADITAPLFQHSAFSIHHSLFFHIDPARRWQGKRSASYHDLIPGPDFLDKLITSKNFSGGAVKLSSAVDFDSLPPPPCHLEIISHNQVVVQAVLWVGALAAPPLSFPPNTRTATLFKNHRLLFSYTATPDRKQIPAKAGAIWAPPYQFLYELDPALTRCQLAAPLADSLHLTPLTIDGGYLLGPSPQLPPHPALTAFQLHQILPYSESKLLNALEKLAIPPTQSAHIEVKTRGKLPGIDTDHLQKLFTAKTAAHFARSAKPTIFIFKPIGDARTHAAIATRMTG